MLIILEGCDGSGKSTLADILKSVLSAEIIHCTSKTPNDKEFFEGIIEASKNKNIIADRFCYGQFVYQRDGQRPLGNISDLNRLEVKLLQAGARVVYVTAPTEEIKERLLERDEFIINSLSVEEVENRFEELFYTKSILSDSITVYNTGGAKK